jgi:predicted transporter
VISFPLSVFFGYVMISYVMISLMSSITSHSILNIGFIFSTIFFILAYSFEPILNEKGKGLIPYYYGIALGFLIYMFFVEYLPSFS